MDREAQVKRCGLAVSVFCQQIVEAYIAGRRAVSLGIVGSLPEESEKQEELAEEFDQRRGVRDGFVNEVF
jgi:hypothetical protein